MRDTPCARTDLMLRGRKILPHPMKQLHPELEPQPAYSAEGPAATAHSVELKRASRISGLPTLPQKPPINTHLSNGSDFLISSLATQSQKKSSLSSEEISTMSHNRSSPLIPEVTPPLQTRSKFQPNLYNLFPSCNTASFITAPETPYSDGENDTTLSSSSTHSQNSSCITTNLRVGENYNKTELYPKLRSEQAHSSPETKYSISPKEFTVPEDKFLVSDEYVGVDRLIPQWDLNLMKRLDIRQVSTHKNDTITQNTNNSTENADVSGSYSQNHEKEPVVYPSWLPRLQKSSKSYYSEPTISQPSTEAARQDGDSMNYSKFSTAAFPLKHHKTADGSLSIGAVAHRTLRHTKKRFSLREFSRQPNNGCGIANTIFGPHPQQCTNLIKSSSTESTHSRVVSSGTLSSRLSQKLRKDVIKNGGIPVIVIPERTTCSISVKSPSLRPTSNQWSRRTTSITSMPPVSYLNESNNELGCCKLPFLQNRILSRFVGSSDCPENTHKSPSLDFIKRTPLDQNKQLNCNKKTLTTERLQAHDLLLVQESKLNTSFSSRQPERCEKLSCQTRFYETEDPQNDTSLVQNPSSQEIPCSQSSYKTAVTKTGNSDPLASPFSPHNRSTWAGNSSASLESFKSLSFHLRNLVTKPSETDPYKLSLTESIVLPHSFSTEEKESFQQFQQSLNPEITFAPSTPKIVYKCYRPKSCSSLSSKDSSAEEVTTSFSRMKAIGPNDPPESSVNEKDISIDLVHPGDQSNEFNTISKIQYKPTTNIPSSKDVVPEIKKPDPLWPLLQYWDNVDEQGVNLGNGNSTEYHAVEYSRLSSLTQRIKRSLGLISSRVSNRLMLHSLDHKPTPSIPKKSNKIAKSSGKFCAKSDAISSTEYKSSWSHGYEDGIGCRLRVISGLRQRSQNIGWSELRLTSRKRRP